MINYTKVYQQDTREMSTKKDNVVSVFDVILYMIEEESVKRKGKHYKSDYSENTRRKSGMLCFKDGVDV